MANGLDIDLHVDESGSPDARSLERIAEAALRHRFKGRVVAGHCCSLALAPDEDRARTIDRVAEAGVAIVSLPMCNMYLQDRTRRAAPRAGAASTCCTSSTPRHCSRCRQRQHARSVLRLWRPRHAGSVSRGDAHPPPRPFRSGPGSACWAAPPRPRSWASPIAGRIAAGGAADLVLTPGPHAAPSWCRRPQSDRAVVVLGGRAIDATLPDYRELDHLDGR